MKATRLWTYLLFCSGDEVGSKGKASAAAESWLVMNSAATAAENRAVEGGGGN